MASRGGNPLVPHPLNKSLTGYRKLTSSILNLWQCLPCKHCWQSRKHCTLTAVGKRERETININCNSHTNVVNEQHTVHVYVHIHCMLWRTIIGGYMYCHLPILEREVSSLDW